MPVSAAATRNANTPANQVNRDLQHRNHQVELTYRKKVAALHRESAPKEKIVNEHSKTVNGGQVTVRIVENIETGERHLHEYWGETKNIPRALRLKRTVGDMLDEDEHEAAEVLNDDEIQDAANLAARRKKKAPAKKQKKAVPSSRSDASRNNEQNDVNQDDAEASTSGARRSARVSNVKPTSASSSRTPRPTSSRREPIIREDEEENHTTTVQDDASNSLHHIDEYNLRRSTRAASDDLNTLSDRMNMFEIKSEAGSDSTRVFSRESSRADPVASTSRH